MSDLQRRPNRTPRRVREKRAYQLGLAGGSAALIAVLGVVLAALDIIGFGLPVLAAVIAVICALMFRRTVSG